MTTKTKVLNPTRHPLHAFIGKDREHARLTAVRGAEQHGCGSTEIGWDAETDLGHGVGIICIAPLRHLSDPAG